MIEPNVLLAIGVVLIFTLIILLVIRTAKKEIEEKNIRAHELGFEPLEEAPYELLSRLEELHQHRENQNLEVENLFNRKEFNRDLYLFDLVDIGDEDTTMGTDVFAVISRELALPHFSLTSLPPYDHDKALGKLMDKILDTVLNLAAKYQKLSRVEFPENSHFDDRIVVFGRDEYAVQNLFSGSIGDLILQHDFLLQLSGSGDFLTMDTSYTLPGRDQDKTLRDIYLVFLDLIRIFEERR